jgi:hypothetical protein
MGDIVSAYFMCTNSRLPYRPILTGVDMGFELYAKRIATRIGWIRPEETTCSSGLMVVVRRVLLFLSFVARLGAASRTHDNAPGLQGRSDG